MSYSTFLEYRNKDLENSLYNWKEKVRQNFIVIEAKDKKIVELGSEVSKLECQVLIEKAKNRDLAYLRSRVPELEYLGVAVKKFLDMTRLGRILDEETTIWEVPCWQMDELSEALRDSKFNSPPKHTEPPHNHPTQIPPQESEHPQTHEG